MVPLAFAFHKSLQLQLLCLHREEAVLTEPFKYEVFIPPL